MSKKRQRSSAAVIIVAWLITSGSRDSDPDFSHRARKSVRSRWPSGPIAFPLQRKKEIVRSKVSSGREQENLKSKV
jgi:hypothetical protein